MKKVMLMISFLMVTIMASAQWYTGGDIGIWRDKGLKSTNLVFMQNLQTSNSDFTIHFKTD